MLWEYHSSMYHREGKNKSFALILHAVGVKMYHIIYEIKKRITVAAGTLDNALKGPAQSSHLFSLISKYS